MERENELKHNELEMMKYLTATKVRYAQQQWESFDKVTQAEMIISDHPEWVNYQAQMEDLTFTYNNLLEFERLHINNSSTD